MNWLAFFSFFSFFFFILLYIVLGYDNMKIRFAAAVVGTGALLYVTYVITLHRFFYPFNVSTAEAATTFDGVACMSLALWCCLMVFAFKMVVSSDG